MRRHTSDPLITAALRDLDAAPRADLTDAERERADATFARIVATPNDAPVPVAPEQRQRHRGRLLAAGGLAGAAGIAGVTIPGLLFGGGNAYGSWTPTPEPLTDVTAAKAATTCRDALAVPDQGERATIAERRGAWTYVLLTGPRSEGACLMPNDLVGRSSTDEDSFFGNYDVEPVAAPVLDPDGFDETASMDANTDEGWFTWTQGYVGSDVTGVTVHSSSGLDIEASVVGNRFAAWWPSREQGSDSPGETWSYSVHLADGSTRNVK